MSALSLSHAVSKSFQDHFSGHASDYARFRPQYPSGLFRFLSDLCANRALAWDCATGNGQAAVALAEYFGQVVATDASKEQITAAIAHPNVCYSVKPAERSGLDDASVDLVTVAQAFHWFDIEAFLAETVRVLKPHGVLAVWSYENCTVCSTIDPVINSIFDEVDDYWPAERVIVESRYQDIALPWPDIEVPFFAMKEEWAVEQLLGYFRTWSATRRYSRDRGQDPIARHEADLRRAWGSGNREVSWPLSIRVSCR